jgi:formylmethanofuran dehydrogenase subunit E
MEIEEFDRWYSLLEDVSDFELKKKIKEMEAGVKFEDCDFCNGMGNVPNTLSTSGKIRCPKCFGAKRLVKSIEY